MKKILIYADKGAHPFCISSLIWSLKQHQLNQKYRICLAHRDSFQDQAWQLNTALVIFPGGRDVPYHQALQGERNQQIRDFVYQGGKFLGICAGGYYGSTSIEFEKGNALEIIANRELKFFPGVAQGPAYSLGKFRYQTEQGARLANLHLPSAPYSLSIAYYNGGCAFLKARHYPTVSILASYADIKGQPAAIVHCQVGQGQAILSGVHPEYSPYFKENREYRKACPFHGLQENRLIDIEKVRYELFKLILDSLQVN